MEKISDIQKKVMDRCALLEAQPKKGIVSKNISDIDKVMFNFKNVSPIVEIHGTSGISYKVDFVDNQTKNILKSDIIKTGEWIQADEQYYIDWVFVVTNMETYTTQNYIFDYKDQTIYITFESNALGDSVAWIPVVEEFRKKHNCKVICSTYYNNIFENVYPDITFIQKGERLTNIDKVYKIGWFGDGRKSFRNKYNCQERNLQQMAMDILGIDYDMIGEIIPKVNIKDNVRKVKEKYVAITTCSTAQLKHWNYQNGWQIIVDFLIKKGYKVVNIGTSPSILKNTINYIGKYPMDDMINIINNCEFFIGLSSGLSWVAWALQKKCIMISGITNYHFDFKHDNYRVENLKVCHGCFNKIEDKYIFDRGNYMFCPVSEKYSEKFECTTNITPDMVKKKIKLVESHIQNNIHTYINDSGDLINIKNNKIIYKYDN